MTPSSSSSSFSRPLSRRAFLAGTGLAVAAACSSGVDDKVALEAGTPSPTGEQPIVGSLASNDLYVGEDQRFALGVLRQVGGDEGYELVRDTEVLLTLTSPDGTRGAPRAAEFHGVGLPADRGVYVQKASFDKPGIWEARINVGDLEGTLPFEVRSKAQAPTPGQPAIAVTTPTVKDGAGVDPICTRTPPCPFHEISLDAALESGKPLAVMFSTPAYCVSRVCGPVLDLLIEAAVEFGGDVNVIHVEVWNDRSTTEASPGMQRWGLQTEPWLFGIDAEGTVVERLEGAFDQAEVKGVLLAAGGEVESEPAA